MSDTWKIEVEALTSEPLPEDPAETLRSFAALDEVGRSPQYAFRSGGVSECPLPYLDVQLHDDQGNPLAGTPVKLDFPGGGGQEARTDSNGRAHFANVDVDASTLDVELTREEPGDTGKPTYRARVHPRGAPTQAPEKSKRRGDDEPILYELPFLDPVELHGPTPPDEEDEDEAPERVDAF